MTITYIFFYRALKAQNIDRSTLPYRGWGQPYMSYAATAILTGILFTFGYETFTNPWDNATFFSNYTFVLLAPITYTFWKVWKRSKIVPPHEVDLVWERPEIDAHEATLPVSVTANAGFWREMRELVDVRRAVRRNINKA